MKKIERIDYKIFNTVRDDLETNLPFYGSLLIRGTDNQITNWLEESITKDGNKVIGRETIKIEQVKYPAEIREL
tara:strand:+ start:573 stop:794 length:222 start_codon:yes stop_codon:yes gene_type:complete